MANRFASGKNAIAECDRCARRVKLKELRELIIKMKRTNIMVCRDCFDPDHPQLQLGMYPVEDPQAVRRPRPDLSRGPSGLTSSRDTQWGWAPVGGGNAAVSGGTPNALAATGYVGIVTVVTS